VLPTKSLYWHSVVENGALSRGSKLGPQKQPCRVFSEGSWHFIIVLYFVPQTAKHGMTFPCSFPVFAVLAHASTGLESAAAVVCKVHVLKVQGRFNLADGTEASSCNFTYVLLVLQRLNLNSYHSTANIRTWKFCCYVT
jgi:hypothetical protein